MNLDFLLVKFTESLIKKELDVHTILEASLLEKHQENHKSFRNFTKTT